MPVTSRPQLVCACFTLAVALSSQNSARCQDLPTAEDSESQKLIFADVAEDGVFFLNGEYVKAPYTVEATAHTIKVNGVECRIAARPQFGGFPRDRGEGFERGSGFGHRPELDRGDGFEPGNGFRGRGERGGFARQNHSGRRDGDDSESSGVAEAGDRPDFQSRGNFGIRWSARHLVESLHQGQVMFLFEDTGELFRVPMMIELDFYELMLTDVSGRELSPAITGVQMRPETLELWKDWLQHYTLPEGVQKKIQTRYDDRKQIESQNNREVAAVSRMNNFSYPLTLLGMLVGVVSLGHLLRWPNKDDEVEAGSKAVRAVEIALWLMMGMALIDLTWTVLASQAGVMREVNPLAENLVKSPLQLAIFKTFATAVGFGIFYLWRQRRQIQVATWWMCLVCVLVTFRWIIFDSAISP